MTAPESPSAAATIDGAPVGFEAAVSEAARMIRASAAPVIAHVGADVEGAREAVLLAERAGAVLDHAGAAALLADLDAMRGSGAMLIAPLEAAERADVVLLVGERVSEAWPELEARVIARGSPKRVIRLKGEDASLSFLAKLSARAKSRPVNGGSPALDALAAALREAKFGVAIWNAGELSALAIESINGLVRDLNETTRFSTLPLGAADQGAGLQTVCGWMTGFPPRTGFARGRPEHDPWRYDARRLAAAGETDCRLWVSAFDGGATPEGDVEIALCAAGSATRARVRIEVGRPGCDHDAILFDPRVGTLVATKASAPAQKPSVAATLAAIRAQWDAASC